MRDYALGTTFDLKFTTRRFSTGAPFTLAGTPVISAYADNSTTEITAGITLTADFDSRTGLNNVRVVATSGNGYAAGSNYALVITTGTVDSVSVVGEVIGEFSLEAQSPLRPTTAGRALDVSADGEAGVDWANVGSPTTTVGLSGTTVKTATDVEIDTANIQSRLPAELTAGGNIKADVLAISGDATAADNLETAADGGSFNLGGGGVVAASVTGAVGSVTGAVGSVTGAVGSVTVVSDKTGYRLSATGVDDVLDEVVEGSTTLRQSVRLANSANGSKLSGAATTTVTIRDIGDTKDRVVATVDSDGNRSALTLDLA